MKLLPSIDSPVQKETKRERDKIYRACNSTGVLMRALGTYAVYKSTIDFFFNSRT